MSSFLIIAITIAVEAVLVLRIRAVNSVLDRTTTQWMEDQ